MANYVRPSDVSDVVNLAKRMHAESAYRDLDFSAPKVAQLALVAANSSGWYLRVAYDGKTPVGMISGQITAYSFSDDKMANDLVWYVIPERRGSPVAVRLAKGYVEWARGHGVREIKLSSSSNVEPEKTARLLERLGFERIGTIHKMRLGHV